MTVIMLPEWDDLCSRSELGFTLLLLRTCITKRRGPSLITGVEQPAHKHHGGPHLPLAAAKRLFPCSAGSRPACLLPAAVDRTVDVLRRLVLTCCTFLFHRPRLLRCRARAAASGSAGAAVDALQRAEASTRGRSAPRGEATFYSKLMFFEHVKCVILISCNFFLFNC